MADDIPQLTIKTLIDSSGADAGADQTATDLKKIASAAEGTTEAAKKTEKGFSKMIEEAGGMQESRRLMAGLFDAMEGGGRTVDGVTDLMRFFLMTVVDINPVMLGLTVIFGGTAAALARHFSETGTAGKKAAEDVKDAWGEAIDELDANLKKIGDEKFFGEQYEAAKKVTDEIKAEAAALSLVQAAQDKLLEAQKKLQLAQLDGQEQQELQGKSGEDEEEIKAKYASLRAEVTAKSQAARDKIEVERAQQKIDYLNKESDAKKAEVQATLEDIGRPGQKLKDATAAIEYDKSDYETARDRLADLQYRQQNAGDEGVQPLTTKDLIDLQNLQGGLVEQLRQDQVNAGRPIFTEREKEAKQERKDLQDTETKVLSGEDTIAGKTPEEQQQILLSWAARIKQLDDFLTRVATFNNANTEVNAASEAIGKVSSENDAFQKAQAAKVTAALDLLQAAKVTVQADETSAAAGTTERHNSRAADETKRSRTARDNELDARIEQLEANLENATDSNKKIFQDLLAKAKDEQIRNKEGDELAGLTLPENATMAQSVRDKAGSATTKINASTAHVESQAALEQQRKETAAQNKQDEATIRELHGRIEATGNKQLIQDTKRILQGVLDKNQQIAVMQAELADASTHGFEAVNEKIRVANQKIRRLEGATQSMRNNSRY